MSPFQSLTFSIDGFFPPFVSKIKGAAFASVLFFGGGGEGGLGA